MGRPYRPKERIEGFDLARGAAVLGMVVVNFSLALAGMGGRPAALHWIVEALSGRAAATFVVLAGVGISLGSRRARTNPEDGEARRRARNALLRRALFLLAVGLLFEPIWPPDILHYYGVYLAVAALWLYRPAGELWTAGAALALSAPVLVIALDYEAGWNFQTLEYSGFWTPAGFLRNLLFNGFHPVVPWLAFVLVGMALGRLDWSSAQVRRRALAWGTAVAATAEIVSYGLVKAAEAIDPGGDLVYLVGRGPLPALPLYMIAATATAVVVITLSIRVAELTTAWPVRALTATGRLALTAYAAHVFLGILPIAVAGWSRPGDLVVPFAAAAVFSAAVATFSIAWLRRFEHGPLERLMRRLTLS